MPTPATFAEIRRHRAQACRGTMSRVRVFRQQRVVVFVLPRRVSRVPRHAAAVPPHAARAARCSMCIRQQFIYNIRWRSPIENVRREIVAPPSPPPSGACVVRLRFVSAAVLYRRPRSARPHLSGTCASLSASECAPQPSGSARWSVRAWGVRMRKFRLARARRSFPGARAVQAARAQPCPGTSCW